MAHSPYINEARRRKIESRIAATALDNPLITWEAVRKVSRAFVVLMEKQLQKGPAIIYQALTTPPGKESPMQVLYSDTAFARLGDAKDKPAEDDKQAFVNDMLRVLKSDDPALTPVMIHIHEKIGSYILRPLLADLYAPNVEVAGPLTIKAGAMPSLRQLAAQKIANSAQARQQLRAQFYLYKGRPRYDLHGPHPRTQYDSPVGTEYVDQAEGEKQRSFIRAADRTLPITSHPYYKSLQGTGIPFVAGPSGHTGILLRSVLTVEDLSIEQLQQYLLAAVAMIVGGGMHSFHEMMIVAQAIGLPYIDGSFYETFPASFTQHAAFGQLVKEFPEISRPLGDVREKKVDDIFVKAVLADDVAVVSELIHSRAVIKPDQSLLTATLLNGHEQTAVELVRSSADISLLDDGCINQSLQLGWYRLAEALLDRGAKVNIVDAAKMRPIDYVVAAKQYPLIDRLLAMGEVLPENSTLNLNDALSYKPHLNNVIEAMIEQVEDLTAQNDPPALLVAAANGNLHALTSLLQNGVNVNVQDKHARSALHVAVRNGHANVVDYLCAQHIDVMSCDDEGNSPMHLAARLGFSKIAQLLLPESNLRCANKSGLTALDLARQHGYVSIIKLIGPKHSSFKYTESSSDVPPSFSDEINSNAEEFKQLAKVHNPSAFFNAFGLAAQKPVAPSQLVEHEAFFEATLKLT